MKAANSLPDRKGPNVIGVRLEVLHGGRRGREDERVAGEGRSWPNPQKKSRGCWRPSRSAPERGIPVRLVRGLALLLPLAELVLAAALLADAARDTSWSLWVAALVLATFLGGQLFLLLKMSRKVGAATCGCFGRPGPIGVSSLSRTAVLLGLAVVGIVIP